eukprot:CAMPEP_0172816748 /NCGR_PEP_ID=MMETSP1075-20121228/12697_1 /TAXON_ID=2916 /ORGANISM="Ceratium fusus, Strain PA161109" /LENGTH=36 /DNA_ID= /DNA_START= /DNA_END= /DNA_ORIENTATION=
MAEAFTQTLEARVKRESGTSGDPRLAPRMRKDEKAS